MELTVRKGDDRFVPPGAYRALAERLRDRASEWADVPCVVLSCFDRTTRLLPFVLYDRFVFPNGARSIAAALYNAGFTSTRAVFQLWTPHFKPQDARLNGKPAQMLLLSSMQMHSQKARRSAESAWSMGEDRPLIIAGGPKAIYEPYHYWSPRDGKPAAPPDVVVTGEQYVLLDLLNVVSEFKLPRDTMRTAFERARRAGALEEVPGLVYLDPNATVEEPRLVDTGLQRLVQCFDELPPEWLGLSLLEPPHRRQGLAAAPLSPRKVHRYGFIVSVVMTQGCKFNCPYCPIPALNQKSWRFRSPDRIAYEFKSIVERFGIKQFFGTDDNFFNHRQTAEEILTAITRAKIGITPLGTRIRLATEATQFDTYKNKDLLPLAKQAGLRFIWFGIEDLTAELVNKGQKPEVTIELFKLLHQNKIGPMAMIMFHEGQPFYTRDSLYGLFNQVDFLRKSGAISLQCTVHTPAVGTREYETTYRSGRVLRKIGGRTIPDSQIDGNHVTVLGATPAWKKQLQLLGGYASFYNPLNFIKAWKCDGSPIRKHRIGYQLVGIIAVVWTALRILPHLFRLMRKPECHTEEPAQTHVPVRNAKTAFSRLPSGAEPVPEPSPRRELTAA